MNQGIRRLLTLAAVFFAAFLVVFAIRNGPDGFKRLFSSDGGAPGYRPEEFTLPTEAPLNLGDVELLSRLNEEYARLTDAVVTAVVSIDTSGVRAQRLWDGFGRQMIRPVPTQGQGSGVIVSHEGHVVTNYHVVKNQQQIQVTLHDGRMYPAKMIGEDPLLDIAVLKIEGDGPLKPLKFGDSSEVRRGQIVFAIGNPFGLGETVTQGIISAVERSVSDTQRDLFQTDAAINPGNSGGPLVNLRGEIIGINAAIYRPDERVNSGFQGVGFSIPSNEVKEVLLTILKRGRPIHVYLGVRMNPDPRMKRQLGYEGPGFVVMHVAEDSPAEASGLRARDVIRAYNGEPVESLTDLFTLVQQTRVGEEVPIEVWRAGEIMTVTAKLAETKPNLGAGGFESPSQGATREPREVLQAIGVEVVDPPLAERRGGARGVMVAEIRPGSLAADKLRTGDRVLAINGQPVDTALDFYLQLSASAAAQATALQLVRDGRQHRAVLPALPREPAETIDPGAEKR